MNPARREHLTALLLDTEKLLPALREAFGSWEYVESYLVGAVAHHLDLEPTKADDLDEADFDAEVLAAELSWRSRSHD